MCLFDRMGRVHIDLSDTPFETALHLKLCQNLFSMTVTQQLSEFYTLAEKSNIGVENGRKLIDALFPDSPHHLFYSNRMLSGSSFDTEHIVNHADMAMHVTHHVNALADKCGVRLASYNIAVDNLAQVGERGDFTAVYGVVREQSGLPFSNQK